MMPRRMFHKTLGLGRALRWFIPLGALLATAGAPVGDPAEAVVARIYTLPFYDTYRIPPQGCFECYPGHKGTDYELGTYGAGGEPVAAATSGTAKPCPPSETAGNYIVLDHGNGHRTRYLHLSAPALPADGEQVGRGSTIGYEGSTGYTYPPGFNHLHFETRHGATTFTCGTGSTEGTPVDPYASSTYMWRSSPTPRYVEKIFYSNADGCADVAGRVLDNQDNNLYGNWGNCTGGFSSYWNTINSQWQWYNWLIGGDYNNDGCADVLARSTAGDMYGSWGNCAGGLADPVLVNQYWQWYNWLLGPGDFNGDGCADVLTRDGAGALYGHWGNCAGGLADPVQIGAGFQLYNYLAAPGDFNGDGCADILARQNTGYIYGRWGNCSGGFSGIKKIDTGWGSYNWLGGSGDFNGDGCGDVLARNNSGNLYGRWGNCAGGVGGPVLISTGWQYFDLLVP